jgi:membrane protein implicated in regulation of membrane protease activity
MSDGLQALPVAAADIAVGVLLARHVSPAVGLVLAAVGVLVLCTVAYRTVRRSDPTESGTRHLA